MYLGAHTVAVPATNHTLPWLGTSASPIDRQPIRSPGTSSVISASHSTVRPNGAPATQ